MPEIFSGNDGAYLEWLKANPNGFVVNARTRDDPSYLVLHRATCWTISRAGSKPGGGFTERAYRKLCADSVEELSSLAESARPARWIVLAVVRHV